MDKKRSCLRSELPLKKFAAGNLAGQRIINKFALRLAYTDGEHSVAADSIPELSEDPETGCGIRTHQNFFEKVFKNFVFEYFLNFDLN